jgi:RNA recognition motif. (a.k.a. RRM, RBD, or RNP domain)
VLVLLGRGCIGVSKAKAEQLPCCFSCYRRALPAEYLVLPGTSSAAHLLCSALHTIICRGFGTVRFATKEDAAAACSKLNNADYEGRTITVRLDRFA